MFWVCRVCVLNLFLLYFERVLECFGCVCFGSVLRCVLAVFCVVCGGGGVVCGGEGGMIEFYLAVWGY